jgi:DNA-binding HxlR family transcriptional regulator
MKSYRQRCPLARALDVIGDRWTLLIVRELLVGPRRYTDLLDGLPGIGTNTLAARLEDLQAAQLVTKQTLPPPTAVSVYELTEAGHKLSSSVRALSEWGEQHGAPVAEQQSVRPAWVLLSAARRRSRLDAGRSCELRVDREVFELTATDTELSLTAGRPRSPDAVISIKPELLYALAAGLTTPQAARAGVETEGDATIVAQILETLGGCAPLQFGPKERRA